MSLSIRDTLREYDVILASSSPRRKDLLQLICSNFRVIPPECDEKLPADIPTSEAAEFLSDIKCRYIAEIYENSIVIGCDTMVICGGVIYGKPHDEEDARRMLRALSGKEHTVVSGVTIGYQKKFLSFSVSTAVTFRHLSDADIDIYCRSGEPMDKAGAYGIQGKGSLLISGIDGDFFNVMGLPVVLLERMLAEFGVYLLK